MRPHSVCPQAQAILGRVPVGAGQLHTRQVYDHQVYSRPAGEGRKRPVQSEVTSVYTDTGGGEYPEAGVLISVQNYPRTEISSFPKNVFF